VGKYFLKEERARALQGIPPPIAARAPAMTVVFAVAKKQKYRDVAMTITHAQKTFTIKLPRSVHMRYWKEDNLIAEE
jgi:hypothetical protein